MNTSESNVDALMLMAKKVKSEKLFSQLNLAHVSKMLFLSLLASFLFITYIVSSLSYAGYYALSTVVTLLTAPMMSSLLDTYLALSKTSRLISNLKERDIDDSSSSSELYEDSIFISRYISRRSVSGKCGSLGMIAYIIFTVMFFALMKLGLLLELDARLSEEYLFTVVFAIVALFLVYSLVAMRKIDLIMRAVFGQGFGDSIIKFTSSSDEQKTEAESIPPLTNDKPISMGDLKEIVEKEVGAFVGSLDDNSLMQFAAELDLEFLLRSQYRNVNLSASRVERDEVRRSEFYYLNLDDSIDNFINGLSKSYAKDSMPMLDVYLKLEDFLSTDGKYSEYAYSCLCSKDVSLSADDYDKSKALELKVKSTLDSMMELFGPYSIVLRDILTERMSQKGLSDVSFVRSDANVAEHFRELYEKSKRPH